MDALDDTVNTSNAHHNGQSNKSNVGTVKCSVRSLNFKEITHTALVFRVMLC